MAVIWTKSVAGVRYELRTAGNTRRLYANGVLHTQYNPQRGITGNVWDLLLLPACFYPSGAIRRVLVLGVGGGAVIHMLERFIQPDTIIGVDNNRVHLQVARRFFAVQGAGIRLHAGDAIDWVRGYDGPKFDMVIDDLFGERDGEPVRGVEATSRWFRDLLGVMTRDGLLVMNFASLRSLRQSGYFSNRAVAQRFRQAFVFSTPQNENAVAAFLRRESSLATLRRRQREALPAGGVLRYRVRTLLR